MVLGARQRLAVRGRLLVLGLAGHDPGRLPPVRHRAGPVRDHGRGAAGVLGRGAGGHPVGAGGDHAAGRPDRGDLRRRRAHGRRRRPAGGVGQPGRFGRVGRHPGRFPGLLLDRQPGSHRAVEPLHLGGHRQSEHDGHGGHAGWPRARRRLGRALVGHRLYGGRGGGAGRAGPHPAARPDAALRAGRRARLRQLAAPLRGEARDVGQHRGRAVAGPAGLLCGDRTRGPRHQRDRHRGGGGGGQRLGHRRRILGHPGAWPPGWRPARPGGRG